MTVYVSKAGSDSNPGTESAPFLTLARARKEARIHPGCEIHVGAGEYRESLVLAPEDSGSRWIGAPGATLTGGLTLPASALAPVPSERANRLTPEAAQRVRIVDLTAFGLTAEDWGPVCVIGGFNTASRLIMYRSRDKS